MEREASAKPRRRAARSPTAAEVLRGDAAPPTPEAARSLEIPLEVIAGAKWRLAQRKRGKFAEQLFSLTPPPPGVLPKGIPDMAQDDVIPGLLNWAAGAFSSVASAIAEGQLFLGYAYLSELALRPEYRLIVEILAEEATREWIEFRSTSDKDKSEKIKELTDALDHFDIQTLFKTIGEKDGFFGIGHIYVDTGSTDNPDELKIPIGNGRNAMSKMKIALAKERKAKLGFRSVEPVWVYPTMYQSVDPLKADWYKPSTWYVMSKEVHRTSLLSLVAREVPDLLKPVYQFGGLSLSEMAKPYVDNWLRTRQSVSDLLHSFVVWVLKTKLDVSTQTGGAEMLFNRAELFNLFRDNNNLMMLDKEMEEFENITATLAGLHELQAQAQEQLASISKTPVVKLLGIQPAGLNASSEGELKSWEDRVRGYQKWFMRPGLTRVVDFIQLWLWGEVDDEITYDFKRLRQLTDLEIAQLQKTQADTRAVDIEYGLITPEEGRKTVAEDPDSQYQGLDLSQPIPEPEGEMAGLGGGSATPEGTPGEESSGVGGLGGLFGGRPKPGSGPEKGPEGQQLPSMSGTDPGRQDQPERLLRRALGGARSLTGMDLAFDRNLALDSVRYFGLAARDNEVRWHGTTERLLDTIREHGLLAKPPEHNWPLKFYADKRGQSVYVARDPRDAVNWAQEVARFTGSHPVVLEVQFPENSELDPDEFAVRQGEERYEHDIPPDWIKRIYLGNDYWEESKHPRDPAGKFSSAGARGFARSETAVSLHERHVVAAKLKHLASQPARVLRDAVGHEAREVKHATGALRAALGCLRGAEHCQPPTDEQARALESFTMRFVLHELPEIMTIGIAQTLARKAVRSLVSAAIRRTSKEHGTGTHVAGHALGHAVSALLGKDEDLDDEELIRKWLEYLAELLESDEDEGGDSQRPFVTDAEWRESDHPRGQPDNPGQFASAPAGSGRKALRPAALNRADWPDHIKKLKVPPAWTDIHYAESPDSPLQVTGRDAKGRPQYLYSAKFRESATAQKFQRVLSLDQKFDSLLAQNEKDLKSRDHKTREAAAAMRLVMLTGLRPGSETDTKATAKAYGATTLEGRHVVQLKSGVRLRFVGKKGVSIDVAIPRELEVDLLNRKAAAGSRGQLFDVSDSDLRRYAASLNGGGFHPKDFRTALGTKIAADAVANLPKPKDAKSYKREVLSVAKAVAARLGNTPSVALKAYINPIVWAEWRAVS